MDDVSWAALTISLTVLGAIATWFVYQRRGTAAAMTAAGVSLLPLAAYLTKTLRMFTRIVDAVADWATSLAFSPRIWVGVILAGVAVLLIIGGRALSARRAGVPAQARSSRRERRTADPRQVRPSDPSGRTSGRTSGSAAASGSAGADDDLADIEAILRKRGIE